jgi:hypothetical protein
VGHHVSADRARELEVVSDTVPRLTGHDAIPLDDFLLAAASTA